MQSKYKVGQLDRNLTLCYLLLALAGIGLNPGKALRHLAQA